MKQKTVGSSEEQKGSCSGVIIGNLIIGRLHQRVFSELARSNTTVDTPFLQH